MKTIAVIGLGLIGGSICKALKKYADHRVWGLDINPQSLTSALDQGAVDALITDPAQLSQCEVVVVALFPSAAVEFIQKHLCFLSKGTLVFDFCGVKQYVCDQVSALCRSRGVRFVGAHPMAGREFWGFDYSNADLFKRASLIITKDAYTTQEDIDEITALARDMDFRTTTLTTPEHHDRMIAFTSQTAHILSNAYVKSPVVMEHEGYSAGSFIDLTRVAKLNEVMWSELFLCNREPLLEELDRLIADLSEYRDALGENDRERLMSALRRGREIKEELTK